MPYETNFVDVFLSKNKFPAETIQAELDLRPEPTDDVPLAQKQEIFILGEVVRDIKKGRFIAALQDANWRQNLASAHYSILPLLSQRKNTVEFRLLIAGELESGIAYHVWRMHRSASRLIEKEDVFMLRLWNGKAGLHNLTDAEMDKFIARPYEPEPKRTYIPSGAVSNVHSRPRSRTIALGGDDPVALEVLTEHKVKQASNHHAKLKSSTFS